MRTLEEMEPHDRHQLPWSALIATHAALKHMPDGGRIISIGSCVGERNMTPGLTAYPQPRGRWKMFTQSLSRKVGRRGITVNNIQPGTDRY